MPSENHIGSLQLGYYYQNRSYFRYTFQRVLFRQVYSFVCMDLSSILKIGQPIRLFPVHVINPDTNCPPVSLQFLDLCQLHNRSANIAQTLRGQVGTGDVLDE